jgi:adenylate kinase family enzyme
MVGNSGCGKSTLAAKLAARMGVPHVELDAMWSWTQHEKYRFRYAAAMADPALAHLPWIRLRTPDAVAAFLSG